MNKVICYLKGHKPRRMRNGWDKLGSGICCDRCDKMLARSRFWLTLNQSNDTVIRFIPKVFLNGKAESRTYGGPHPRGGYK